MRRHMVAALAVWLLLVGAAVASQDPPAEPKPPSPPAATAYRGNTKSHKFHKQSCRYFKCPNCTAKFATREEAIEAGYRPCGVCDP